jgi:ABC-type transporter Mla subunit MlaD
VQIALTQVMTQFIAFTGSLADLSQMFAGMGSTAEDIARITTAMSQAIDKVNALKQSFGGLIAAIVNFKAIQMIPEAATGEEIRKPNPGSS